MIVSAMKLAPMLVFFNIDETQNPRTFFVVINIDEANLLRSLTP
jgi:hypothetical protein